MFIQSAGFDEVVDGDIDYAACDRLKEAVRLVVDDMNLNLDARLSTIIAEAIRRDIEDQAQRLGLSDQDVKRMNDIHLTVELGY